MAISDFLKNKRNGEEAFQFTAENVIASPKSDRLKAWRFSKNQSRILQQLRTSGASQETIDRMIDRWSKK